MKTLGQIKSMTEEEIIAEIKATKDIDYNYALMNELDRREPYCFDDLDEEPTPLADEFIRLLKEESEG